jgi:hypothetical protein
MGQNRTEAYLHRTATGRADGCEQGFADRDGEMERWGGKEKKRSVRVKLSSSLVMFTGDAGWGKGLRDPERMLKPDADRIKDT